MMGSGGSGGIRDGKVRGIKRRGSLHPEENVLVTNMGQCPKCCSMMNGIIEAKDTMGSHGTTTLSRCDGEGAVSEQAPLWGPHLS